MLMYSFFKPKVWQKQLKSFGESHPLSLPLYDTNSELNKGLCRTHTHTHTHEKKIGLNQFQDYTFYAQEELKYKKVSKKLEFAHKHVEM